MTRMSLDMKGPDGWSSMSALKDLEMTIHVGAPCGVLLSSGGLTWGRAEQGVHPTCGWIKYVNMRTHLDRNFV